MREMFKRFGNFNLKKSNLLQEESVSPQITRVTSLELITPPASEPPPPSLNVIRPAYNVSKFNEDYVPIPTTTAEKYACLRCECSPKSWIKRLRNLFPITLWLPEYNFKENLLADIIVGITIASFQVPQSMAYSFIAHVPPVYGLYSAFFPSLFYTVLGTGMHVSFGTFAITSGLMTGTIVTSTMAQLKKPLDATVIGTHSATATTSATTIASTSSTISSSITQSFMSTVSTTTATIPTDDFPDLKNIEVAIIVAFIIGVYIFVFGVFQLGFISNFMSEELISGFITACSFITFFSQVGNMIGIKLTSFSGPGNLPLGIIEVFERTKEVNMYTIKISGICLSILLIFKLGIDRFTLKYFPTPFPIELCVIISGILASHYMNLHGPHYKVSIVGTIGNNFPAAITPRYGLIPLVWDKCIATAIVSYIITLSVAKIYGKKHGYKPDANQELLAIGSINMISALFQCLPAAASLPRSALQETSGGKTQLVSLINCCCIIVVIFALGHYLAMLPTCVLGSCIATALVSLFPKVCEFWRFWKVSKLDGMIWMITFLSTLLISIDIGIYIGLIVSVLLLVYKSERCKIYLLGTVEGLDIYVPINKFDKVNEVEGIKIFQMCGALNFSNAEHFSNELEEKCGLDLNTLQKFMKTKKYKLSLEEVEKSHCEDCPKISLIRLALNQKLPKYVIIDCSMFAFIDWKGINTIRKIIQNFEKIGIKVVLSGIQVHLESILTKEGFFADISKDQLYKSIHDAVIYLKEFDADLEEHNTLSSKAVFGSFRSSGSEFESHDNPVFEMNRF